MREHNTRGLIRLVKISIFCSTLCSEKNTHSHFLPYLNEWCVFKQKAHIPKERQILTM